MKFTFTHVPVHLLLASIFILMTGTTVRAEPIRHAQDCADVWLYIASWVQISFDDDTGFFIDIEAGEESAADMKWFTATANCAATISGIFTPPPDTPAGIIWDWSFQPHNVTSFDIAANETVNARVKIHPTGNDIETIPAGLYKDGSFCVVIDALNPEPDTTPFPL